MTDLPTLLTIAAAVELIGLIADALKGNNE
jgi:hypothetical protein